MLTLFRTQAAKTVRKWAPKGLPETAVQARFPGVGRPDGVGARAGVSLAAGMLRADRLRMVVDRIREAGVALVLGPPHHVADRMGGIDDQIQNDLVDIVHVAGDEGEVPQFNLQIGHVLEFATRDGESILERAVEVKGIRSASPVADFAGDRA